FVRLKADDPAHVLPGYDYDVTDEDALLHTIRLEGNVLVGPSGVHWRALALPKSRRLSPLDLERIVWLAREGARIIGLPPVSPVGRVSTEQASRFVDIVHEVWGSDCQSGTQHSYGKGTVLCTADAHVALLALHVLP